MPTIVACPECKSGIVEGAKTCPQCHVKLKPTWWARWGRKASNLVSVGAVVATLLVGVWSALDAKQTLTRATEAKAEMEAARFAADIASSSAEVAKTKADIALGKAEGLLQRTEELRLDITKTRMYGRLDIWDACRFGSDKRNCEREEALLIRAAEAVAIAISERPNKENCRSVLNMFKAIVEHGTGTHHYMRDESIAILDEACRAHQSDGKAN